MFFTLQPTASHISDQVEDEPEIAVDNLQWANIEQSANSEATTTNRSSESQPQ